MAIFSLSGLISQTLTIGTETIELDGIREVNHTSSSNVTSHPVDEGFNFTDAQHQQPKQVTFQAFINDNPQSAFDDRVFATLANSTGLDLVEGHVKKQLSKLEAEKDKGSLITIKTKYALYEDYYCTSFSYREDSKMGIIINVSIMEKQDNSSEDRTTANFSPDIGLWS